MSKLKRDVHVQLGDGVATIRREGQSRLVVANILGTEANKAGVVQEVYLDRLVHRPGEEQFLGWSARGAISTILSRA